MVFVGGETGRLFLYFHQISVFPKPLISSPPLDGLGAWRTEGALCSITMMLLETLIRTSQSSLPHTSHGDLAHTQHISRVLTILV